MKIKKITTIFLIIFLFILIGTLILTFSLNYNKQITGEFIRGQYTYTKAICNGTNYCQDYEIVCSGNEITSINPILGAVIQNPLDWEDPRDKNTIEEFCDISN